MFAEWLCVLAPTLGLGANAICQFLFLRLIGPMQLFRSIVVGFVAGMAACVFLTFAAASYQSITMPDLAALMLLNIAIVTALGYGYFHFNNLGETGRRIRILSEIASSGPLGEKSLLERYNANEILERRLGRLMSKNQIALRNGRFVITKPTVLLMANVMAFIGQRLLLLGTGARSR